MRHPAKFSDSFMSVFAEMLNGSTNVLDPFAGTGKIGQIKALGFNGSVYANEIEPEWLESNEHSCDVISYQDAEFLDYPIGFFDAICTSPTYGNRMADHHVAKDGSRRNTYTHCLGRQLADCNTGKMQWGKEYRAKHFRIYAHLHALLKKDGKFILNVKNHIRKGQEIDVTAFHIEALETCGFEVVERYFIPTNGLKHGANADKRTNGEYIVMLKKVN